MSSNRFSGLYRGTGVCIWVRGYFCLWVGGGVYLHLGLGDVSASESRWCLPLGLLHPLDTSPSAHPLDTHKTPWTPTPTPGHTSGTYPLDTPPFTTPSPWTEWITDACENITFSQTSFAGGKNNVWEKSFNVFVPLCNVFP